MKCFVLGCKSSSNKRKNNEEKRSFFTVPKDVSSQPLLLNV